MILKYNKINDENAKNIKINGIEFNVLKQKDFDNYKKEKENNNEIVTVLRNTSLKKYKEKDSDNDEYIEISNEKFQLKKEKSHLAKGYINVGCNNFVRLESNILILVILFILLLGMISSCIFLSKDNPKIPENPFDIEDSNFWDGKEQQNGDVSQANQDSTIIPGYSKINATEGSSMVQLYNPPENTVYFIYTITSLENKEKEKTFENINEAQEYINDNTVTYSNYYDEQTNKYMLKDEFGNITDKFIEYKIEQTKNGNDVYKLTNKVIYFTKAIEPNNKKDWNVLDFFDKGTYNVQFRITPYDINTKEVCYGAISDVEINVH